MSQNQTTSTGAVAGNGTAGKSTATSAYSSINTVSTVTRRELSVLLRSKGIIISVLVVLLVTIGGIFSASYFLNKDEAPTLVVAGMDTQPFQEVNDAFAQKSGSGSEDSRPAVVTGGTGAEDNSRIIIEKADSEQAATQAVRDGKSAALVAEGQGAETKYKLISDGQADPAIMALVSASLSSYAQNQALNAVGVNPQEFAQAMPPSVFDSVDIGEHDSSETNFPAVITALIGVSLMAFFYMLFAGNIGSRVTEEKSSRVVEIILATVRPLDFLVGKLTANVLVGFSCSLLILGSASIAIAATGLLKDISLDLSIIPLLLLSFLIALLFFGSLYVAAGALVSRTEDLQSTQAPIMLLAMGTIYGPVFGVSALDSTVMQVLSWIPPFSLTIAPLQFAGGNMNIGMLLLSVLLALVVTGFVMVLVSRIYRNAILHNGTRMSWITAIKGS